MKKYKIDSCSILGQRIKLEKNLENYKKNFQININNLQAECPHNNLRYQPDASGNNGGEYYCPDCGVHFNYYPKKPKLQTND